MALRPQNCVPRGDRLWFWTCTLLTIGVVARVVTSFAQASFAQEHLIALLLEPSCPGQCYVLPHTWGQGRCGGCVVPRVRADGKDPSSWLHWLLPSCLQQDHAAIIMHFPIAFLAGKYWLLSLWLPSRETNLHIINGWLFGSYLAPCCGCIGQRGDAEGHSPQAHFNPWETLETVCTSVLLVTVGREHP